jgi:hypothetical protein
MNATHVCAHLSAELEELEELETNGLDRSVGELAMAQADTTQSVDQHVGHCRPELVWGFWRQVKFMECVLFLLRLDRPRSRAVARLR